MLGKASLPKIDPPHDASTRHAFPEIVRAFKSFSAKWINALWHVQSISVWQRNIHERVIRNEHEMDRIWRYIEANPSMWMTDDENPSHAKPPGMSPHRNRQSPRPLPKQWL
jgi:hypothetical protein